MNDQRGLGCDDWWSDPEWERADTPERKRSFVLGRLHVFNRERLMDVMYDRLRERWAEVDLTEDLPSANNEIEDRPRLTPEETPEHMFFDGIPSFHPVYDYRPEEWQAVLDQMGATPSEVRDVMVRLGFERWRRD